MSQVPEAVQQWLDEAATAMGGGAKSRHDVLLELETNILDRVEERTTRGQIPDEAVRDVLDAMGDPVEVGSSFIPVRPLIAPERTRPYLFHTAVLFVMHFLVVVGATVLDRELALGPLRVLPLSNARNALELLGRAVATLLFDAGAVLVVYAVLPRLGAFIRFPRLGLRVRPDGRRSMQGACFLALVLVVANFFRDNLFALYVPDGDGILQIPFVGPGIVDNLLLLNLWIGSAIVRDLLYAKQGETRFTLMVDVVSNVFGLFCLLRIVATGRLVVLSAPALEALDASADSMAAVLNTVFVLLALMTATMLAARAVRRAWRWSLIGS